MTVTLSIDAMHEESAENKLDGFLSALDLKKNDKLNLVDLGELVPSDGESTPKEGKKKLPKLSLDDEDEWDDSWEDEDWDELDEEEPEEAEEEPEEEPEEPEEEPEEPEEEPEEPEEEAVEPEEPEEEAEDSGDFDDLLAHINADDPEPEEEPEEPEEEDFEDDDEDWGDWE